MAVIMDYLDWRGDLPFSLDSFNEVDGYILAKFGCPDYTGAVPDTPDAISIGSAVKQYFALHGEEEGEKLGVLASSEIIPAIRRLVDLPRYRDRMSPNSFPLCRFSCQTEPYTLRSGVPMIPCSAGKKTL